MEITSLEEMAKREAEQTSFSATRWSIHDATFMAYKHGVKEGLSIKVAAELVQVFLTSRNKSTYRMVKEITEYAEEYANLSQN